MTCPHCEGSGLVDGGDVRVVCACAAGFAAMMRILREFE